MDHSTKTNEENMFAIQNMQKSEKHLESENAGQKE